MNAHQVTMLRLEENLPIDLRAFEQIVIGASIRYGTHSKQVVEFVRRHRQVLESKPSAFFSVNIVARKPEKNSPETNPYLRKFLAQTNWQPPLQAVFAGKLDYPRYRFFDRLMIRLIMKMTNGPTAPDTVIEFTDWAKVDDFAAALGKVS